MKKISKKELLNTKRGLVNLKKTIAPIVAISMLVGCSNDPDPNKPVETKTAIIINGNNAVLVPDIDDWYDLQINKTDKVLYGLTTTSGDYITVYDDKDTSVNIVRGVDSFEKAQQLAESLVGEEGTVSIYGSNTKTLTKTAE